MIGQFSVVWRIIRDVAQDMGLPEVLITGPFTSPSIEAARKEVQGRAAEIGLAVSQDCRDVSARSVNCDDRRGAGQNGEDLTILAARPCFCCMEDAICECRVHRVKVTH